MKISPRFTCSVPADRLARRVPATRLKDNDPCGDTGQYIRSPLATVGIRGFSAFPVKFGEPSPRIRSGRFRAGAVSLRTRSVETFFCEDEL